MGGALAYMGNMLGRIILSERIGEGRVPISSGVTVHGFSLAAGQKNDRSNRKRSFIGT